MLKQSQRQEILKRGLYDFVSRHYWELSKEDLADLIKEFWYAVYQLDGQATCNLLECKMLKGIEFEEED